MANVDSLDADRRGDHRPAMGERLEQLDARAAARAQRHDHQVRPAVEGRDVDHVGREDDPGRRR